MSFSKPQTLGLIACPGAEDFTKKIARNLRGLYKKRYEQKAHRLSKRYNQTPGEVMTQMNFAIDLHSPLYRKLGAVEKFRPPEFLVPVDYSRFANGEFKAEILSSIRGMDLFLVQDVENHYPIRFSPTGPDYRLSVNDHVMCLFVTVDAVMQAGANSVTLVLPTYPFARQHKKKSREALTASWFGRVCESMGVDRIITLDLHSREIENTFNHLRLENLHGSYQILKEFLQIIDLKKSELTVVSPDTGAIDRNKFYAGSLQKPLAVLYKERDYSRVTKDAANNNITSMRLLGSVEGKTIFLADDMIGTGGTLLKALRHLKQFGAKQTICAVSLPMFNGNAVEHFDEGFREGLFYRIIGTDAIYHGSDLLEREWYICAGITNLFSRIITRLHHNLSLSTLLDNRAIIRRLLQEYQE